MTELMTGLSWLQDVQVNFHFLRPEWFYALIPAAILFALLRYRNSHHSNWETAIEPHLLEHILDNPDSQVSRSPFTILLLAWLSSSRRGLFPWRLVAGALALQFAPLAAIDDTETIGKAIKALVERNRDVMSAALRGRITPSPGT